MARILIANDNSDLLESCRAILEDDGHVVDIVADGGLAMARALTWQPDLIIIDWVMPYVDGPTAIGVLRAQAATALLPILLMSGTEDAENSAIEIGANGFLRKPFHAGELRAQVNDLLQAAAAIGATPSS